MWLPSVPHPQLIPLQSTLLILSEVMERREAWQFECFKNVPEVILWPCHPSYGFTGSSVGRCSPLSLGWGSKRLWRQWRPEALGLWWSAHLMLPFWEDAKGKRIGERNKLLMTKRVSTTVKPRAGNQEFALLIPICSKPNCTLPATLCRPFIHSFIELFSRYLLTIYYKL